MRPGIRRRLAAPATLCLLALAALLPGTASADFSHTVTAGESLASIASADGLSVDQLAAANGLSSASQLVAGTQLSIPPQDASAAATGAGPDTASLPAASDPDGDGDSDGEGAVAAPSASTESAGAVAGGYVVQPGDTLSALAARAGLTVSELAAQNGLSPDGVLVSGTHLSVPGAAAGPATSVPVAAETGATPVASAPQPTGQSVTASDVGSIASTEGVPASLAEAIAYQESGFNNGEVSSTGATGVMQIEPGTWNYIGSNLAGPPPLQSGSVTDNIRAGSLLLHSLLAQTGGDESLAAAAYYQGLDSVRRNGMYADTQRYVNDVMALQARFAGQG